MMSTASIQRRTMIDTSTTHYTAIRIAALLLSLVRAEGLLITYGSFGVD